MYCLARCKCILWSAHLFYWIFVRIFIHNWQSFMSEVLYLYQTFISYVYNPIINVNVIILICQHTRCDSMLWRLIILRCYWIFYHNWWPFISNVLYLHQTFKGYVSNWYVYSGLLGVKTEVYRWKVNLCNHFWLRQSSFIFSHYWFIVNFCPSK